MYSIINRRYNSVNSIVTTADEMIVADGGGLATGMASGRLSPRRI